MLPSQLLLPLAILAGVAPVSAGFENMFANMFKQQQQQQQQQPGGTWIEQNYDNGKWKGQKVLKCEIWNLKKIRLTPIKNVAGCDGFLCTDTLTCVSKPVDCPCVFPNSEIKCVLPNKKSYVCISKPSEEDKTPRDCAFVEKAYKGLV